MSPLPPGDTGDTVLLTSRRGPVRGGRGRGGRRRVLAAAGLVLAVGLAAVGLRVWQEGGPGPSVAVPPPVAPSVGVPLMEREALLGWRPAETGLIRLAERPAVFVIVFPDLSQQGRMMNRLAALLEKARAPRDRVLDDAALAAAIAAEGGDPDTYYYGHDYSLGDVDRFFAMARASGVVLNAEETWLEGRLPEMRAAAAVGPAAIITLPSESDRFDASARRTVLDHEIAHGRFFTDPAFAAHVLQAWRDTFTEADRDAFRRFLAREGYDSAIEAMMANEAMAYLLFTPDPRFFDPARDLGIDAASAERLRTAMRWPERRGEPPGQPPGAVPGNPGRAMEAGSSSFLP